MIQVRKWPLVVVRLVTLFTCLVIKAQDGTIIIRVTWSLARIRGNDCPQTRALSLNFYEAGAMSAR